MEQPIYLWRPLVSNVVIERAEQTAKTFIDNHDGVLDIVSLEKCEIVAVQLIESCMKFTAWSDRLSNVVHMMIGWGNCKIGEIYLLERLADFCQPLADGKLRIQQRSHEGDIHPWQSITYALLSGLNPSCNIPVINCSIEEIAFNSFDLNTSDGIELGHLLLSISLIGHYPQEPWAVFSGVPCTLHQLLEAAIDGHENGEFYVCSKFHLTEGICALSTKFPEFSEYRGHASRFLEGQIHTGYILLAALLKSEEIARERNFLVSRDPELDIIRDTLSIWGQIENHFYQAGHLIELASIAVLCGFELGDHQVKLINVISNKMSDLLIEHGLNLAMSEAALGLSHFRRGISLWRGLTSGNITDFSQISKLTEYTANFRGNENENYRSKQFTRLLPGNYLSGPDRSSPSKNFQEVLDLAVTTFEWEMRPRGEYAHFRRLGPRHWPRSIHFEFLEEGGRVYPMFHSEAGEYLGLVEELISCVPTLNINFGQDKVLVKNSFGNKLFEIRLVVLDNIPAKEVVLMMQNLVRIIKPVIDCRISF